MKVCLIVAMDENHGIGKNNDLMWHLPADMKFFKEMTSGNIVVMGRKNFESIPEKYRPLPNRENVVISRNKDYDAQGCKLFDSLKACLEYYQFEKSRTVFIIGGGEIYNLALKANCVDEMYITHVKHLFDADTFFPQIDFEKWEASKILKFEADQKNIHSFEIVHYSKK